MESDIIKDLIYASEEWHSVDDCDVEGVTDCPLCQAIKAAWKYDGGKEKDLTFKQFGKVFKMYQNLHEDAWNMYAKFNAWSGDNPNVGIYYGSDHCYTSSQNYCSAQELYDNMVEELLDSGIDESEIS